MNIDDEFRELTQRLYAVISAPAEDRDWDDARALFHPRATMVRTGIDYTGNPFAQVFTYEEYIANATALLAGVRFQEREISQQHQVLGQVARLASIYEYEFSSADERRVGQGVNLINLIDEGNGWKIINMIWDNERDGVSLSESGLV